MRSGERHYNIVNSCLALERLGYTKETEVPGGEIWKDEDGEPTGFLLKAAHAPLLQYVP